MSELDELQVGAATPAPEVTPVPEAAQPQPTPDPHVEGIDYNIPLSDSQKLLITRIQNKKLALAKQKADIEANEAKVDAYFHGQLVKIGQDNKIDMTKFVLSEDLDIKPMPEQPVPAPRR
jgi:hypothetical protein